MLGSIVNKELTEMVRDRRLRVLAAIVAVLCAVAVAAGAQRQHAYENEHSSAVAADRDIWHGQGEVNPHSAAHFGLYAFKPRSPMAAFDPGLAPWLGDAIWLEAHYQNPPEARAAQTDPVLQRLGDLSAAWMLQTLLPLLIVLAGFATIAGERERGSLRVQLIQGAKGTTLVLGKLLALLSASSALVVILICAAGLAAIAAGPISGDLFVRWSSLLGLYVTYAVLWAAVTVGVSALASSARHSLVILLALWTAAVIVTPRLAAEHAAAAHPLPAAGEFWEAVVNARSQGIDGHDPADAKIAALREATLRSYGVASVEQLPFDFAGLALQAGEESSNVIYDRLYGDIVQSERAQSSMLQLYAPISMLIPVKTLSAALAGNDLVHQHAFTAAAEAHRRMVQRRLNEEQRLHGKGLNFNNRVAADFWHSLPTFEYSAPTLTSVARNYSFPLLMLAMWLVAAALLAIFSGRRLETRA